ncbi:MAG: protoporphyrinogen oxidase HemJ [Gammaproteobacteria bacterium]|nr:protoporphyrinogen oxidase HemJ [Gammaproteobacteria bacterium]
MLWLKAFHVIAMVTWFAGLFYLPRLFVYHAETTDPPGLARFETMERRLFKLMTIGGAATIVLGIGLLASTPAELRSFWLRAGWLHAKLGCVAVLIAYHAQCYRLMRAFAQGRNRHSSRWYRVYNEIPSLLLIAIVVLVIVKPF